MAAPPGRAIFVFPSASGHVNPSLPLARALVSTGWSVDYLCIAQFKEAIEDTGATFCDRDVVFKEFGIENVTEMVMATFAEYNDPKAMPPMGWGMIFGSIAALRYLPAFINWFRSREPQLVVYCPVLCQAAHFAAMRLRIPDVSVLTASGPGYLDAAFAAAGASPGDIAASVGANAANATAVEGIRSELAMPELTLNTAEPLTCDHYTSTNIVTTTLELADPLSERDVEFYRAAGKTFHFVGPLLDVSGAKRAATGPAAPGPDVDEAQTLLMTRAAAATAAGRPVVYVSMGTVVTSDNEGHGWNATSGSALTGRQLCHAVFRAVFEELGSDQEDAPLIAVSLGSQPDALDGISVPSNAACARVVPQVDLLRTARPTLFVTNGGQNSLMESMAVGTPVVVCPGFGDQVTNAAKVETRGWGVKVSRPAAEAASAEEAASSFQASLRSAVRKVMGGAEFAAKAQTIAAGLEHAEGVPGALRAMLSAAEAPLAGGPRQ